MVVVWKLCLHMIHSQRENNLIAYVSMSLEPKLVGQSTYEKEYVSNLLVVKGWRPYLWLGEFVIATDQKSLSYLIEQRLHHT
jgi:hypothetical protein